MDKNDGSWTRLIWLGLYATAMGLLEVICVIYLRRLLPSEPNHPASTGHPMHLETIREACTIVMLATSAFLAGTTGRSRVACFFFAFGLWDIFYYVGLKWWAGWPGGFTTWDCLFLIPKPWYSPVLAPILISGYFVLACCVLQVHEIRGRVILRPVTALSFQFAALAIWYYSFVQHSAQIKAAGFNGIDYSWSLFATGLAVAVTGLCLTCMNAV